MILAQPFPRSNRSYHSWSTTAGLPVVAETANERATTGASPIGHRSTMVRKPPSSTCQHSTGASSTYATLTASNLQQHPPAMRRCATMSRADLEKAKGRQFATPISVFQEPIFKPPMSPVNANLFYSNQTTYKYPQTVKSKSTHSWTSPEAQQVESQHYAATSFTRGTPVPPSESGRSYRSGRESVLSSIMDKFETLKRRISISRSSRPGSSPRTNSLVHKQNHKLKPDQIYAEGCLALDRNSNKRDTFKEDEIGEAEMRCYVDEKSMRQPEFRQLVSSLTNWINDELAEQRIIVKDLIEDLYDGQVLGKLFEKLQGVDFDIVEVTQNANTQRQKLNVLLNHINRVLKLQARWVSVKWSVEGINGKNLVETLHLLITLARYYRAPIELPPNVSVEQQTVQRIHGQILRRSQQVLLTTSNFNSSSSLLTLSGKRDAFDVLFESAPEKLLFVQQSLMRFCNRHLNKIGMSCFPSSSIAESTILNARQFSDGLLLIFLISSVEDYFVPLGNLFTTYSKSSLLSHSTSHYASTIGIFSEGYDQTSVINCPTAIQPTSYTNTKSIQLLHNVNLAFQLMEDAGIQVRKLARPEDIVNGDLKCLLRVLFTLFSRYKHL